MEEQAEYYSLQKNKTKQRIFNKLCNADHGKELW